jgi:hypothetical protein
VTNWIVGKEYKTRGGRQTAVYVGPSIFSDGTPALVFRMTNRLGYAGLINYWLDGSSKWRSDLDVISDEPTEKERQFVYRLASAVGIQTILRSEYRPGDYVEGTIQSRLLKLIREISSQ